MKSDLRWGELSGAFWTRFRSLSVLQVRKRMKRGRINKDITRWSITYHEHIKKNCGIVSSYNEAHPSSSSSSDASFCASFIKSSWNLGREVCCKSYRREPIAAIAFHKNFALCWVAMVKFSVCNHCHFFLFIFLVLLFVMMMVTIVVKNVAVLHLSNCNVLMIEVDGEYETDRRGVTGKSAWNWMRVQSQGMRYHDLGWWHCYVGTHQKP